MQFYLATFVLLERERRLILVNGNGNFHLGKGAFFLSFTNSSVVILADWFRDM